MMNKNEFYKKKEIYILTEINLIENRHTICHPSQY